MLSWLSFLPSSGHSLPDHAGHAQAGRSHHRPVPRGWQGVHTLASLGLPALLDVLCSRLILGLLDNDTSLPWHYW